MAIRMFNSTTKSTVSSNLMIFATVFFMLKICLRYNSTQSLSSSSMLL